MNAPNSAYRKAFTLLPNTSSGMDGPKKGLPADKNNLSSPAGSGIENYLFKGWMETIQP